ncbi:hypothetical protein M408DRAFT_24673 [Serendipita vermifera MAFF 305830]|uniref:Uncharacterized protein n=1 Tax=Serendipita vermifera MAFF 305830 TaxID=933852 RepID=A0A0C3B6W9_SERVB|nr:hypothetical protein M408DRAFT_24673 [Serendipita vermifera MAFF 305830]
MSTPSRRNIARRSAVSQTPSSRASQPYSEEGRNSSIASRRLRAARGSDEEDPASTYHQQAPRARTRERIRTQKVITSEALYDARGLAMGSSGHNQHRLEQTEDYLNGIYRPDTEAQVTNSLGLYLQGQGDLANRLFFPSTASLPDEEMLDYVTETESGSMHTALMRDAWDDNSTDVGSTVTSMDAPMSIVYDDYSSSESDVTIHSRHSHSRSSTPRQAGGPLAETRRECSHNNDSRSVETDEETDSISGFFSLSEDDDDEDGETEDEQQDAPPATRHAHCEPRFSQRLIAFTDKRSDNPSPQRRQPQRQRSPSPFPSPRWSRGRALRQYRLV